MNVLVLVAAAAIGGGAAAIASLVVPPTRRLAAASGRTRSSHELRSVIRPTSSASRGAISAHGVVGRLFGPPLRAILPHLGRANGWGDERLARLLRQAGVDETTPDEFRTRQIGEGAVVAAIAGVAVSRC